MFQIESKSIISKAIKSAREAIKKDFVPHNLGFKHISRADFIAKHTRPFVQQILADGQPVAVVVLDGTYIYIEKSSNYQFQRRSFSGHKHRPLVKPMMIVASDGYILSVLGLYFSDGKNNDASILKSMLQANTEDLRNWLQEGDLFVVDRGFRDCLDLLESLGYRSEMPKGCKQHTTEEANHSRLVTKVRWVVESANGRLKKWKALDQVMPNSQLQWIGDYVEIVCAISNKFRPPLVTDKPDDAILELQMSFLSKRENRLQKRVDEEKLASKRVIWKSLTSEDLEEFPKLSEDHLRELTLGVYQLKQARSYTQEHLHPDGNYEISVHRDADGLIRVKFQSRHVSSKSYSLWISYDSEKRNPITGWYCQCRVGARTVGCCAHIAAVLWYLGFQRHSSEPVSLPTQHGVHLLDSADNDWDSETEEEGDQAG